MIKYLFSKNAVIYIDLVTNFKSYNPKIIAANSSTSFIVFLFPNEKRIQFLDSSILKPIEFKTCDGSEFAEVQAEPNDTA